MEETLLHMVETLGFPIAICLWLIFRFENRIKILETALAGLEKHIIKLESYISFNEAKSFFDHDGWSKREAK